MEKTKIKTKLAKIGYFTKRRCTADLLNNTGTHKITQDHYFNTESPFKTQHSKQLLIVCRCTRFAGCVALL